MAQFNAHTFFYRRRSIIHFMGKKFCNSCGAELSEGVKFCEQCGSAVTPDVSDTPPVLPSQPPAGPEPSPQVFPALAGAGRKKRPGAAPFRDYRDTGHCRRDCFSCSVTIRGKPSSRPGRHLRYLGHLRYLLVPSWRHGTTGGQRQLQRHLPICIPMH